MVQRLSSYSVLSMTLDVTKSRPETFSQSADVGNSMSYINNSFPLIILFGLALRELKDVITVKCAVALVPPFQESVMFMMHYGRDFQQEDNSLVAILMFLLLLLLSLILVSDVFSICEFWTFRDSIINFSVITFFGVFSAITF